MGLTQSDIDEITIAFDLNGAKNNVEIREAFQKILDSGSGTVEKSYIAFVSQTGTNAPTVDSVKSNTLGGTPVWARTGTGTYTLTLADAFVEGDTQVMSFRWYDNTEDAEAYFYHRINPSDTGDLITFFTFNDAISSLQDDTFNNTPIEIKIYG